MSLTLSRAPGRRDCGRRGSRDWSARGALPSALKSWSPSRVVVTKDVPLHGQMCPGSKTVPVDSHFQLLEASLRWG